MNLKEKWNKLRKYTYEGKWISFYFSNIFNLTYEHCGYFDSRPNLRLALGFFNLTIRLPWHNKGWEDEGHSPSYGIAIHNNTFWIYTGGKGNMNGGSTWITWDIPFITHNWVRTSILLKDGTWEHETKGNRKEFYNDEWKEKQATWTYLYTDKYDNTEIPTRIYVDEREWRPKWLMWTSRFAKVRRSIDIHFDKEVGARKGSWKGGTIGCGYNMLPNEEPLDCLKRMEKERNL